MKKPTVQTLNIPIFLQPGERTFQSAKLLENGQHKFTFTDSDGLARTWVYEGTTGGDDRDLLTGKETAGSSDTLHGGGGDDILYGGWTENDIGRDTLYGDGGKDKLYGGAGNDTLIGGAGDDTLIGGAGIDTYIITTGDGQDIIIDSGKNILKIDGEVFAGVFTRAEGTNSYVYTSGDQTYTMVFGSSGGSTLSINGNTSINFVNQTSAADFDDHKFGISLLEALPVTDLTLAGTVYRDEMSIDDFGFDPANWELMYTSFPTLTPQEPFYYETLPAVAPRMKITGGASGDFLFGFLQHDEISGGDGGDIINGNLTSYNDKPITMTGAMEGDLLDGGAGDDWISGSGGVDQIIGSEGNDFLTGLNGDDFLRGDAGNDVLAGGSHADTLTGGDGDDILAGDGYFTGSMLLSLDTLASLGVEMTASEAGYYTGYVTRNFGIHNDAPNGGDDILLGGAGRDMLFGGTGADVLDGGTESDALFGGDGDDWLYGGDGNDWLVGDNGDLTGDGNDTLDGGAGKDLLYGLGGNDTLSGGDGVDQLYGYAGNDQLTGGSQADVLVGTDQCATTDDYHWRQAV